MTSQGKGEQRVGCKKSGDRSVGRLVTAVAARHVRDGAAAVVLIGDAPLVVDQFAPLTKVRHHPPVEGLPFRADSNYTLRKLGSG